MKSILIFSSLVMTLAIGCGGGESTPADGSTPPEDGGADAKLADGSVDAAADTDTPTPDTSPPDAEPDAGETDPFSFFVTSLDTMRSQSGSSDGFGGDLGGLAGADGICQTAAAAVGAGGKTWRAFLSVTDGGGGSPVNAIDRIGDGPWYDRNGRLVAMNIAGLIGDRPSGDAQTVDDLPDETGLALSILGDTHDVMTGSGEDGRLRSMSSATTCNDWTSSVGPGSESQVYCGHSWPRTGGPGGPGGGGSGGSHWISAHPMRGCSPGVNLVQDGPGSGDCVGCGGGWGAIYCFAL